MPADFKHPLDLDADDLDVGLLQQLERQSVREIAKLRSHQRVDMRVRLVLEPGNSSQRGELKLEGHTADISSGGLRAILPGPVAVGDVYRLSFDQNELDLPLIFARCLRCGLLREDAFDCGFKFFAPLVIRDLEAGPNAPLL